MKDLLYILSANIAFAFIVYLFLYLKFSRKLYILSRGELREQVNRDILDFYKHAESYIVLLDNRIKQYKNILKMQEELEKNWTPDKVRENLHSIQKAREELKEELQDLQKQKELWMNKALSAEKNFEDSDLAENKKNIAAGEVVQKTKHRGDSRDKSFTEKKKVNLFTSKHAHSKKQEDFISPLVNDIQDVVDIDELKAKAALEKQSDSKKRISAKKGFPEAAALDNNHINIKKKELSSGKDDATVKKKSKEESSFVNFVSSLGRMIAPSVINTDASKNRVSEFENKLKENLDTFAKQPQGVAKQEKISNTMDVYEPDTGAPKQAEQPRSNVKRNPFDKNVEEVSTLKPGEKRLVRMLSEEIKKGDKEFKEEFLNTLFKLKDESTPAPERADKSLNSFGENVNVYRKNLPPKSRQDEISSPLLNEDFVVPEEKNPAAFYTPSELEEKLKPFDTNEQKIIELKKLGMKTYEISNYLLLSQAEVNLVLNLNL